MLVLLWGIGAEEPLAAVHQELIRLGAAVCVVDQHEVLNTEIELHIAANVGGTVWTKDQVIDLTKVTACYLRPYDSRDLPSVARKGPDSWARQHAAAIDAVLSCWSEITPGLVVNRLAAMAGNGSKPYQLAHIRRFGFRVPDTVVTTDPGVAWAFLEAPWIGYLQVGKRGPQPGLTPETRTSRTPRGRRFMPDSVPKIHCRHRLPGARRRHRGVRL
jgi:hypothetical protein